MNLYELGFSSGKVILPGLDVVIEISQNQYFRNDGVVSSLEEHAFSLKDETSLFELETKLEIKKGFEDCSGLCYCREWNQKEICLIVVCDSGLSRFIGFCTPF